MKITDILVEDDDDEENDFARGASTSGTARKTKNAYNASVSTNLVDPPLDNPDWKDPDGNIDYSSVDEQSFRVLNNVADKTVVAVNMYLRSGESGAKIYKGVNRDAPVILTDPTKVERTAANTFNYINLLTSTLPSWQEFPPRNKSLICSTQKAIAGGYGKGRPYIVLPFGDPEVGVCRANDFWLSFRDGIYPPALNSMLNTLGVYLLNRKITAMGTASIHSNNANEFYADLAEMDKALVHAVETVPEPQWLLRIKESRLQGNVGRLLLNPSYTFVEKLDELLDPGDHGFGLEKLSTLQAEGREVWLSAPSILVKEDVLDRWIHWRQQNVQF